MNAFLEWKSIPGLQVLETHEIGEYLPNTLTVSRKILGALKPSHSEQVAEIVKIAAKYKIPLYTISTGNNWGYGSALPVVSGCMILDLKKLNRILHLDPHLGTVTLEPGVTQQQLSDFLTERNLAYLVPTTGAGPTGSLLGNALERGYGITPHVDHFNSILSLKAILPDGSLYQSSLSELGGYRSDTVFKWKIGPFLDGLFAQGNFGIVTQMTISLARRPEEVMQFVAFIPDENFEEAVVALRNLKQDLGSLLGGVNLMNKRRLLSMVENDDVWKSNEVKSEVQIRKLAKKRKLPDWAMLGGIYAPPELRAGTKEIIRKELQPFAQRVLFLGRKQIRLLDKILKIFPIQALARTASSMSEALNILEGRPSRVALRLAYLKNRTHPISQPPLSPDREGCGLIWFSPLLPMEPAMARDFAQSMTQVCISQGIEPLITLTGISERCFDATIPLVFDASSETERKKARQCYDALVSAAREFGIFPYRLDIESMRKYYDGTDGVSLRMAAALKNAIDPDGILSPGRYQSMESNK